MMGEFLCVPSCVTLPDMSLADQHSCMMDALGQSQFEDLGLQAALQEILEAQTQHVIKLHLALIQYAHANQTTQQGVTCTRDTVQIPTCTKIKRIKHIQTLKEMTTYLDIFLMDIESIIVRNSDLVMTSHSNTMVTLHTLHN